MNIGGDNLKSRLENEKLMNGSEIRNILVNYKRFVDQNPKLIDIYPKIVVQALEFDDNLKSEYKRLNSVCSKLTELIDIINFNQESPENLDNEIISSAQLIQDAMDNLVDFSFFIDGIELIKNGLNLTPKKDAYSYTDKEKETIKRYSQCIEGLKRCIDYQKYIEERLEDLKREIKRQQKEIGMEIPEEGNLNNNVIKSKSAIGKIGLFFIIIKFFVKNI